MRTFHYFSGEVVTVGDHVRDCGHLGTVVDIIQPGPEAAANYHCPDGAVCTEADWGGTKGNRLWTPPDGELWEDLEFIARRA